MTKIINFENKKMPYTYEYPRPAVTVDAILIDKTNEPEILLVNRKFYPFEGMWALPGGFVDIDETLEEAVIRELEEETGITGIKLEQFGAFSEINRDPRHRTISVIFIAFVEKETLQITAGDDAADAKWFKLKNIKELAFDHFEIVKLAEKKYLL